MLTRNDFIEAFRVTLGALRGAEDVTKRELKALSRSLLSALHGKDDALLTGDIQFINETLVVLSPMNRKMCELFFQHFAGFHFAAELRIFSKKDAKGYADKQAAALAALEDPNFNVFSWAEREVVVERKPLDVEKVSAFIKNALKKAQKDNIPRKDVLRAVFAGGFSAVEVVQLIDLMAQEAAALDAVRNAAQGAGVAQA
jgi:hypothetical protein